MKINLSLFIASLFSFSTILYSGTKAEEDLVNSTSTASTLKSEENFATSISHAEETSIPSTSISKAEESSTTSLKTLKSEESSNTSTSTAKIEESTTTLAEKTIDSTVKSVLMVCSTNQCRSPIAAAVFDELAKTKGVREEWHCESAGIYVYSPEARWNMDKRARSTLRNHGIMERNHEAREVNERDFSNFDYILGMDETNVEDLRKKAPAGSKAKIELLSAYDPKGSKSIRYPFYDKYSEGFEECYKIVYRACDAFLSKYSS